MTDEVTNDIKQYNRAMMNNMTGYALSIEKKYGLDGYPPQIVGGILSLMTEGKSRDDAEQEYFEGIK